MPGYFVLTANPLESPLKIKNQSLFDFIPFAKKTADKRVKKATVVSIQTFCEHMIVTGSIQRKKADKRPIRRLNKRAPKMFTRGIKKTPNRREIYSAETSRGPNIFMDNVIRNVKRGGCLNSGSKK